MGRRCSNFEIEAGSTLVDLLEIIGINRETALVRLNGEIAVEEETLRDGDSVEVIMAISGG